MKVSISKGNSKMGAIPSVSLPPIITCPANAPCAKKCYAAKLARIYPSVRKSYENNLDILNSDWDEYWRQVRGAVSMARYFRFHVAGDIPNAAYFKEDDLEEIEDQTLYDFDDKFAGIDEYGRKYSQGWLAAAYKSGDEWIYFGKNSSEAHMVGFFYSVE